MDDVVVNLGKQMNLLFEQGNVSEAMAICEKVDDLSSQVRSKKVLAYFYYLCGAGLFACLNRSRLSGTYTLEQLKSRTDVLEQCLIYCENAIAALKKATQIDNTFVEAYFLLGQALEVKGKWPEAMEAYQHASGLESNWKDDIEKRIGSLWRKM